MTITELLKRQREVHAKLRSADITEEEKTQLMNEFEANKREIAITEQEANAPKAHVDKNAQLREAVKMVRTNQIENTFELKRTATSAITSGVIQSGEVTNMASAGIPLTIKDLINPMEMGLIYDKLGIKIATNVKGQIQWPVLDTAAEVSVGGELDDAELKTLDFSKITAVPVKLGISVEVSNEAVNDASFDLVGTVTAQMNKAVGRTLNKRVIALAAPSSKADFVGPLKQIATASGTTGVATHKVTFAGAVPTYAEIKSLKGKVLAGGAQMAGFCYIMDAAMYSKLETVSKDSGSGRFIIENGQIDGDLVFVTDSTEYAGKVGAGCFGYVALNQHGASNFVIDPYTKAKKNVTVFTLNADWSITLLAKADAKIPFAVGVATT